MCMWSGTLCQAKFWLDPVRLHDSTGFVPAELGRVEKVVAQHVEQLRRGLG